MLYSEFTLEQLEKKINLIIQEEMDLFPKIEPINPSNLLREILKINLPLALDIDTEKARSELIVAPILVELRNLFEHQISIFSGRDFSIDKEKGLTGRCDFLISQSPKQLIITAPVVILVEAKNDNIQSGIAQCLAEMFAAQIFNEQKQNQIACIYGCVTTGSLWKFMKLEKNLVFLESKEHFIGTIELILGILSYIIKNTKPKT
jgi:hypothetical protein